MPLTNTTIVPPESPDDILNAENTIKMIVIGDRPTLADRADLLSLNSPLVFRRVIWFKQDIPESMRTKYSIKGSTQAFVLNIKNVLKDEISVFEHSDNLRLNIAYAKGAEV